jgi:hypothetical protein
MTDRSSPSLSELMARYLERQSADQAAGLGFAEPSGEVVPYEAARVQPVEPRAAWEEAIAAVRFFPPAADLRSLRTPPEWSNVIAMHEPVASLPFCVGNYPQLVRDLHPLLHADDLVALRPTTGKPLAVPGLVEWAQRQAAERQFPQALLAVGCLRLTRQFDALDSIFALKDRAPAEWQSAWGNEQAAAEWHRGRIGEADTLWSKQPESVPVLFNRGMAALFLDRAADASALLDRAVAQIPQTSAWHHLGRLYRTLAEVRR